MEDGPSRALFRDMAGVVTFYPLRPLALLLWVSSLYSRGHVILGGTIHLD